MLTEGDRRIRLIGGMPVVEVRTHTRRETKPGYKFPPLMEDKRDNNFATRDGIDITVLLTHVAGPYTGEGGLHLMAIPDSHPDAIGNKENIPDITHLTPPDLGTLLQTGTDAASAMLEKLPNIDHVDVGINYSKKDDKDLSRFKQKLNTFPDNVHLHITGYASDIEEKDWKDVERDPDLLGRTGDRIHAVTQEIFTHEVIEKEFGEDEAFKRLFVQITDARGRLRFKMKSGSDGFKDPQLPRILQTIHTRANELYDEVGNCFFVSENEKFVEDDTDHGRYKLLPQEVRMARLEQYFDERTWLSEVSKNELRRLGEKVQTAQAVLKRGEKKRLSVEEKTDYRSDTNDKIIANAFWANKGLAYSMVWSAQRGESSEIEWVFGFDPKIFTVEGVPQSSSSMTHIITKEEGAFSPDVLTGIQQHETEVVDALLTQKENGIPVYEKGTKTPAQL